MSDAVLIALITGSTALLTVVIVALMKAWSDNRVKAVTLQATIVDNKRIIYIGEADADMNQMANTMRRLGISNRLMNFDSVHDGYAFIRDNTNFVLFIVVWVAKIQRGEQFLALMNGNDKTEQIPVFLLDDLGAKGHMIALEMGGTDYLQQPFDLTALATILNRLNYNTTFAKQ